MAAAAVALGCSSASDAPSDDGGAGAGATGGAAGAVVDAAPDAASEAGPAFPLTARPFGTTAAANGFLEYLPPGYGDGTLRPLLVYWHGANGGTGDEVDVWSMTMDGPPKLISYGQWPASRPFVVLAPRHMGSGCATQTETHDFIAFALGAYQIDPKRVYLTGLSCGAIGSAAYLAQYGGQQVAASVLICGDASPIWEAWKCAFLNDSGLWALHGDADTVVSIDGDNAAMTQFLACPQPRKDARFTVYPGQGHYVFEQTYDLSAGHDIYAWMLGISR
jgi:poly(3-hydroxybutyrate) depolymerase